MGLAAEVLAAPDPRVRCSVQEFVATRLTDEERAELSELLTMDAAKTSAIFRSLVKRGLTVRYNAVAKHRRGDCSCGSA